MRLLLRHGRDARHSGEPWMAWATLLMGRHHLTLCVRPMLWRLAAFLPLPVKPVNRVYVGPLEIEWS